MSLARAALTVLLGGGASFALAPLLRSDDQQAGAGWRVRLWRHLETLRTRQGEIGEHDAYPILISS